MEPSRERIVFVTMKLKPKFGWSRMPLPVAVRECAGRNAEDNPITIIGRYNTINDPLRNAGLNNEVQLLRGLTFEGSGVGYNGIVLNVAVGLTITNCVVQNFSGCKPHPATAPAGSNRSSHGGNEVAEAFG
jgi:hypothetical protein